MICVHRSVAHDTYFCSFCSVWSRIERLVKRRDMHGTRSDDHGTRSDGAGIR